MNIIAPAGTVWVCHACGKRSRDRWGLQKISPGWDESCRAEAVLCYEATLVCSEDGSVVLRANAVEEQP